MREETMVEIVDEDMNDIVYEKEEAFSNEESDSQITSGGLFDGDEGELSLPVRRVYANLIKQRHVSELANPKEWQILLDNKQVLTSRFHDMFIDLVVDETRGVAYKRQVRDEGSQVQTLLPSSTMNAEQTLLMFHLRELLRTKNDEVLFVDKTDLLDFVAMSRPLNATNEVRDVNAAENAVRSLLETSVLIRIRDDDSRYRVSPIVEALMPVSVVNEIAETVKANTKSKTVNIENETNVGDI